MTNWSLFRAKKYSQTDEESVLINLVDHFSPQNRYIVDIGAGDGAYLSNSLIFVESGWEACRIDSNHCNESDSTMHKELITQENACSILSKYNVPYRPGILSIDIDGIDLYVLNSVLKSFRPTIVVFEFNGCLDADEFNVIAYDDSFTWDGSDYYGASWSAFVHVLSMHGYSVVHHSGSLNGYAVDGALIPERIDRMPERVQYHRHDESRMWLDARDVFSPW
jgi:hypothetical protein